MPPSMHASGELVQWVGDGEPAHVAGTDLKRAVRVTACNDAILGFLQRFLGYCMTGCVHEHVLVFLYGTGANGKSVFVDTVSGIFGDYAIPAPIEMFLASKYDRHPTEIARLKGARLVVAQETTKG